MAIISFLLSLISHILMLRLKQLHEQAVEIFKKKSPLQQLKAFGTDRDLLRPNVNSC